MCGCEKKNCWCQESTSTIRKKICVDIAWYDPDDVCKNKLVIKFADSCQVILGIDNCETVTPVLPSAPTNWYVTDSNWWAYDCGNPILWWTASPTSWVTYTIREWAAVIASWVSANTYTVSWASAWVHSYTVEAVNWAWSSSVLTINAFVTVCLTIPNAVTGLTSTDSNGWVYNCWNPILNRTASALATSYDIFEWAALLWNTVWNTFTIVWATTWSHTYTVVAKNTAWSSTGVNVIVNITVCLSAPLNITGTINVYNSGTATNYTCGLWFDVNFTDVATATYYQLFEWATQIGSNSATSNFVVTGQTAGSHTYTIRACNWAWCSTGTSFTVTVAACAVSKAVNLSGQTFSSSWNATDNTWRFLFPIDSTALWTAIATNNSWYTACGGWNGVYDLLNGFFIPPITGTYTFTFWAYIQSPNCNWALWMNMEAAIGVHALNWIYSWLNRQWTTLWTCASTTPIPLTITQTLNAGTCYALIVWWFPTWGNAQMTWAVISNLIIS